MPSSCMRQKFSVTAAVRWGSMVNTSRVKSNDAPRRRIWLPMRSLYSSFHANTFSRNASRP